MRKNNIHGLFILPGGGYDTSAGVGDRRRYLFHGQYNPVCRLAGARHESDVSYYTYCIGTEPGLDDIAAWTETVVSGPRDIPVNLSYGNTYYVSVTATNSRGLVSDPVSTDGIIVLDPYGDPDSDFFITMDELDAGSDPLNTHSIPGMSVLNLKKGFNMVSFPAETYTYAYLSQLLEDIGGADVISKVLVFNPFGQIFDVAGFNTNSQFYGENIPLPLGDGLDGMIIYAKTDHTKTFTTQYCRFFEIDEGVNLTGSGCVESGLTAFGLLQDIYLHFGPVRIQRYSQDSGRFETAVISVDSEIIGVDFPIVSGEGYFLFKKEIGE